MEFNSSKSLSCKVIIKQGSIVQPIAAVLDLNIDILKDPSASENPVTHQGFKLSFWFMLINIDVNKFISSDLIAYLLLE